MFNGDLIKEAEAPLRELSRIQEGLCVNNDELLGKIQEYRVAKELGFSLINQDKHGFDAKYSEDVDVFLEIKNVTLSEAPKATLNDTTLEKARNFKCDNLWLALGVWHNISKLSFICYGKNKKIGELLEEKVSNFLAGNGVRSVQDLSLSSLVEDYDFRLLAISDTPEDICKLLRKPWLGFIDTKEDFEEPYFKKDWNENSVLAMVRKRHPIKVTYRG